MRLRPALWAAGAGPAAAQTAPREAALIRVHSRSEAEANRHRSYRTAIGAKSTFQCRQCGKTHTGLPKDQGFKLFDEVWAVPEPERSQRARWDTDFCQMGDRFFIRCLLPVPFAGSESDYYGWGVWAEVDREVFLRYVQLYDVDASGEPPATGTLANSVPLYGDADRAQVTIHFGSQNDRPTLTFEELSNSLAHDQRHGLSQEKFHDILVATGAL